MLHRSVVRHKETTENLLRLLSSNQKLGGLVMLPPFLWHEVTFHLLADVDVVELIPLSGSQESGVFIGKLEIRYKAEGDAWITIVAKPVFNHVKLDQNFNNSKTTWTQKMTQLWRFGLRMKNNSSKFCRQNEPRISLAWGLGYAGPTRLIR